MLKKAQKGNIVIGVVTIPEDPKIETILSEFLDNNQLKRAHPIQLALEKTLKTKGYQVGGMLVAIQG